jgi:hypothetical protein
MTCGCVRNIHLNTFHLYKTTGMVLCDRLRPPPSKSHVLFDLRIWNNVAKYAVYHSFI